MGRKIVLFLLVLILSGCGSTINVSTKDKLMKQGFVEIEKATKLNNSNQQDMYNELLKKTEYNELNYLLYGTYLVGFNNSDLQIIINSIQDPDGNYELFYYLNQNNELNYGCFYNNKEEKNNININEKTIEDKVVKKATKNNQEIIIGDPTQKNDIPISFTNINDFLQIYFQEVYSKE